MRSFISRFTSIASTQPLPCKTHPYRLRGKPRFLSKRYHRNISRKRHFYHNTLEKSTCTWSYVLFNGLYYLKDEFYQSKIHLPKPFILFFSSFIFKNIDSMKSRKLRLRKWLVHFSPKKKRKEKYDPSYAGSRSRKSKVEAPLITPLLRAIFSSFSFSLLSLNFFFCCVTTRAWTEQSLRNTWNRHDLHLSFYPSDFSTLASILYLVGNKFEISKSVFAFGYRAQLDDEDDSGDGFERSSLFQL